jgi:hypothetical protein
VVNSRKSWSNAAARSGSPRPAPAVSARWSAQTALGLADITLSELRPETLAGYGALDVDTSAEVSALVDDLRTVVGRGVALLHERDRGGLAERLAGLPGRVGRILRALERLSAEQDLAEMRSLIETAAERAAAGTLDVGVFGRVGAGKSSLITALVEQITQRLARAAPATLDAAEQAVTDSWSRGQDGGAAARKAILDSASAALAATQQALESVRMNTGAQAPAGGARRLPPLFDSEFLDRLPPLPPPRAGGRL